MRSFLVLTLMAAVSAGTGKWSNMRVKYGTAEAGNDEEFLWKVPNTLEEALESRWQAVPIDNNLDVQFVGVSQTDFGFNPFYDANGLIAGAQLCQPETIVATGPPSYLPLISGTNERKTLSGSAYICSDFLLVDPTTLRSGGRRAFDGLGEGIWLRDTTDRVTGYRYVPDDADRLLQLTQFTQQNCFPGMGKHYFYNFTYDFNCDGFNSWFLLGQENDVTGVGWQIFGQKTVVDYDWYDFLPRIAAEMIAPVVHECLYDWIDAYTIVSVHVFFTEEPWAIACGEGDSVETKEQQILRLEKLHARNHPEML